MGLVKNILKYSHCIFGRYEIIPPTPAEEARNSMGGLDAEQFYESSGTSGLVPFKFLAELKMTQNGQILFDSYYQALKVVVKEMFLQTEEYCRKKQISQRDLQTMPLDKIRNRLAIRIRVFVPRVYHDKTDVEILFFVKGDEKGEKDFEKVCEGAGLLSVVKLAECLAVPLEQASHSIESIVAGNIPR